MQNYLADGAPSDLIKAMEVLGEDVILDAVTHAMAQGGDMELRAAVRPCIMSRRRHIPVRTDAYQGLGVLVNLSWGLEKMRLSITSRSDLVDLLSQALVSGSISMITLALAE